MRNIAIIFILILISVSCYRRNEMKSFEKNDDLCSQTFCATDTLIFKDWKTITGSFICKNILKDSLLVLFQSDTDYFLAIMSNGVFFRNKLLDTVCDKYIIQQGDFQIIDNDYPTLSLAYNQDDSIVYGRRDGALRHTEIISAHSNELIEMIRHAYDVESVVNIVRQHTKKNNFVLQIMEGTCMQEGKVIIIEDLSPGMMVRYSSNKTPWIQYKDSYVPDVRQYVLNEQCEW